MDTSIYNSSPSPLSGILLCGVVLSAILLATLPGGNLINIGISVAFVGVVLFNAIAGNRSLWFSPEILILVAWLSFSIAGTFVAVDSETAMFKQLTMVQVMLLAFCIQQVIIWNKASNTSLITYGIAVSISYLLTFTQFSAQEVAGAEDVAGDTARVASTLNDENTFGAVALMGFSFALIAIAQNTKKSLTIPYSILLVLLFVAVVNSGSRTAFLGAFIVLIGSTWAFKMWRGAVFGKFLVTAFIALIISAGVFFAARSIPEVQDRIDAVFDADSAIASRVVGFIDVLASGDTKAEDGNSIDERVAMIDTGLEVIANSPIIGVGLDNFRTVSGAGTYAHSNLIEVAASTGLIGFVIYHLMYVVLTLRIFKLTRVKGASGTVARLALVGLMAYFLMDITRVSYYEKTSWIYFAVLGALVEIHLSESREALKEHSSTKGLKRRRRKSKRSKQADGESNDGFEDIDELFSEQS